MERVKYPNGNYYFLKLPFGYFLLIITFRGGHRHGKNKNCRVKSNKTKARVNL